MKNMLSLFLVATALTTVSCKKDKNAPKKEANPEGTWQQVGTTGGMIANPAIHLDKTYRISLQSSSYKLFKKDAEIASGTYSTEKRTQQPGNKEVVAITLKDIPLEFQPGLLRDDTLFLGSGINDGPTYIFLK
ncbi:hypothetical protein [Chitinophaga defluvii]|uniref:Lipocalin-like protein n=1 Tax=Chitinophaga defluvii TaxID=3163343 RepID=A0ABV2TDI5_9BACT